MQSTGGKEQHSAAVQLGKGVRDTIQVVQGPLPVLNILYIYILILLLYILYIIYICYVCVRLCAVAGAGCQVPRLNSFKA